MKLKQTEAEIEYTIHENEYVPVSIEIRNPWQDSASFLVVKKGKLHCIRQQQSTEFDWKATR